MRGCSAAHSSVRLITVVPPRQVCGCNDRRSSESRPERETTIVNASPTSAYVIRPAREQDLGAVADVYESVAAEGRYIAGELPVDKPARLREWRERFLHSDDAAMFVGDAHNVIVGHAGISGTGVADLGMCVAREWRGRGVGSALLEACIGWARSRDAHKIALQVWPDNAAALALYRKYGFLQEGYLRKHWRRRSGELWDAIVMGLLLEP
jgi:RimJ/RimL family protein N-acetyltransferase